MGWALVVSSGNGHSRLRVPGRMAMGSGGHTPDTPGT